MNTVGARRTGNIDAASSSLSLSNATLQLAFAMRVASAASEVLGRKRVMVASLLVAGGLAALCASTGLQPVAHFSRPVGPQPLRAALGGDGLCGG